MKVVHVEAMNRARRLNIYLYTHIYCKLKRTTHPDALYGLQSHATHSPTVFSTLLTQL